MSLNDIPSSERIHIGIFGRTNAGKSSVMNAVMGQNLAIVSNIKGTTTDPVKKAMELLPLGPVVLTDTPGLDDEGELGEKRMEKTYQVLHHTDIAMLIVDSTDYRKRSQLEEHDAEALQKLKEMKIPYIVVLNKTDLLEQTEKIQIEMLFSEAESVLSVSGKTNQNIHELKELLATKVVADDQKRRLVGHLLQPNDFVVLVIPIDKAAPKGRLILPQQQVIRDVLEASAVPVMTKDTELKSTLQNLLKQPALVITDSQAFARVSKETPEEIPLTSFSILLARYKGDLQQQIDGAKMLDRLQDGDRVLIAEGCTHHRQCDDIGTVKLPGWIKNYTGKKLQFCFNSGTEFDSDLTKYKMIIHCGGCTLNEKEMKYRILAAVKQKVPITNYGVAIAYMHGILKRSIAVFDDIVI